MAAAAPTFKKRCEAGRTVLTGEAPGMPLRHTFFKGGTIADSTV